MSSKYTRHQSVVSRQSDQTDSEDSWLNRFEKSLLKDAVQPRAQVSLFDQINSIMNGKAKYTSVEAAVEDMKQRSGLTAYLAKLNKVSEDANDASTTKVASVDVEFDVLADMCRNAIQAGDWKELGKCVGQIDSKSGDPKINSVESIRTLKYFRDPEISACRVPVDQWIEYGKGYAEGVGSTEEEKEKDLNFTRSILEKFFSKKASSDNQEAIDKKVDMTPIVVKKHPAIKKTLENYIRDTKGNLPVPAIIEKIRSIHQTDVTDGKDWDDDKLIILVSKMNLGAKKENPSLFQNYSNLGTRDSDSDSEIDPSNNDAFFALTPVKQ